MSTNPTLVFIPGGWHTAAVWDKVIHLLESQGYTCIAITLPSCSSNPSATFKDDIQAVRAAILSETNDNNHGVVLVAWSYGGQVANSAVKGLTSPTTTSTTAEPHGRILGLTLIASGFTQTGVGFLEATGGVPPPFFTLNATTGFADLTANATELFYHDLPLLEAQHWESQLTNLSLKALAEGGEHAYAGWKELPVWFLVPTGDRALPADVQRGFVKSAREQGGMVEVREVEGAGHAVILSRAEEVVGLLEEAVDAFGS
jgi:pimeloyl-ACP methyl ester carboxylesterase